MSKRILLIYPPSPVLNREDRCQQPTKDLLVIPPLPPTDLMYLASVAEDEGLEAKIVDYSLGGDFETDLTEFKPDYLLINVATPTLHNDLGILELAKKCCPKICTIAKGAAFMNYNFQALHDYKYLDFVIVGEAEETLREILQEKPHNEILGIYYRDGFITKFSGTRPFIENLDSLTFPARHLIDNQIYKRPDNNKVQAVVKVSRGCPYHCFFCLATPVSGAKVRMRSAENIIQEIKECIKKYNIKNFLFWSDCFDFDRDWTIDLCKKIISAKLNITWSANTRADLVDEKLIHIMKKAGCKLVSIGVESGSQYILDKIGKKITIDQIMKTVKLFKKYRIKIYNYFVIGLPWDDEDTIEETINFAITLNSDFVSFYTATPLPGTRFYNYAKKESLLEDDMDFSHAYFNPVVKTFALSKERVLELHKSAIRRFYLRPTYILQALSKIRSFAEIINYTKAGLNLLFRK